MMWALAVCAAFLVSACVGVVVARGQVDGVAVLAVVFLAVHVWAVGGFRRDFWSH